MSMTLEESIRFHTEEAERMRLMKQDKRINKLIFGSESYEGLLEEHEQMAKWLKILKKAKFEYDEAWRIITHPTPDVRYPDIDRAKMILDVFRDSLGRMD